MHPDDEWPLTSDMTLIEVIRTAPQATAIFEDLRIDYACAGATTLKSVAANVGLTPNELMSMIEIEPRVSSSVWNDGSLSGLTIFLVSDHKYIQAELFPRIRLGIDATIARLGPLPLLRRMHELELTLAETVFEHATSEEQDLFPIVDNLEAAAASVAVKPPKARISARVLREVIEHEIIRDRVRDLRDLAGELPLDDGIALLRLDLRTFQRHLHEHMHLENNVLYPRAIALENALRHASDRQRIYV